MPIEVGDFAFCDLAAAKAYLKIPDADTTKDQLIADLVTGASQAIENLLQTNFIKRDLVQDYSLDDFSGQLITVDPPANFVVGATGGYRRVYLRNKPIVAVDSITDTAGGSCTQFVIFGSKGYLQGIFPVPFDTQGLISFWTIAYTAGRYDDRDALAAADMSIVQAAKMTLAIWFYHRDPYVIRKDIGDLTLGYEKGLSGRGASAVPVEALNMLSGFAGDSV